MKKNRALTKVIAMALAIATIFSVMSMSFTASAMDMENASKKAASAIITTGVGEIPVVGSFAKSALSPILSELFGIKGDDDAILEKLDEISTKLDELKNTLDKDTQEILKSLNDTQKNEFNKSMTSLRTMVENNYKFLKEIEKSDSSNFTKAVLTAEMLDFNMNNAEELEVLTETLTEYVNGTEFKTSDTLNIYDFVYRVKCDGSVFGGEAAVKASSYINSVNEIITASYKLMSLVLGEKLYFSDNYDEIMEAAETDAVLKSALKTISGEDLAKYSVSVYRSYWAELLSGSYTKEYNAVYSLDNPDSTVSKYNRMVLDNWFTYVREVRYSADSITVNFVYLNSEMNFATPDSCGLNRAEYPGLVQQMIKDVTNDIKNKTYSALTKEELQKLYAHVMSSEILGKDENGNQLSLYDALKAYGFTFDRLEAAGADGALYPIFTYDASFSYQHTAIVTLIIAKANYTGYNGLDTRLSSRTVSYFNYIYNGKGIEETGSTELNAIVYFTAV